MLPRVSPIGTLEKMVERLYPRPLVTKKGIGRGQQSGLVSDRPSAVYVNSCQIPDLTQILTSPHLQKGIMV